MRVAGDRIGGVVAQLAGAGGKRRVRGTLPAPNFVVLQGVDGVAQDRGIVMQRLAQDGHDLGALLGGEALGARRDRPGCEQSQHAAQRGQPLEGI